MKKLTVGALLAFTLVATDGFGAHNKQVMVDANDLSSPDSYVEVYLTGAEKRVIPGKEVGKFDLEGTIESIIVHDKAFKSESKKVADKSHLNKINADIKRMRTPILYLSVEDTSLAILIQDVSKGRGSAGTTIIID